MAMSKAPSDSLVIESPWESREARSSDICQVSAVPLTGYGVVCPSALGSLSDVFCGDLIYKARFSHLSG